VVVHCQNDEKPSAFMKLSIIIPVLNEAQHIQATLLPLQPLRQRGHEIIVVDGGSGDDTIKQAQCLADNILTSAKGRACQMNAGAAQAQGDVYWFLHGDTRAMPHADTLIEQALGSTTHWGRFNVRLSGTQVLFRVIETLMNLRSCLSGIATGDQGIFIRKNVFNELGGYPEIALMEDIALSQRLLKKIGRPACVRARLITSSRRWEQHGIIKTILLMWRMRLAYFFGASPESLARRYNKT
jgi:rSAM/selenodomain-associated transferase 2